MVVAYLDAVVGHAIVGRGDELHELLRLIDQA
jgi:hypothetical protein